MIRIGAHSGEIEIDIAIPVDIDSVDLPLVEQGVPVGVTAPGEQVNRHAQVKSAAGAVVVERTHLE